MNGVDCFRDMQTSFRDRDLNFNFSKLEDISDNESMVLGMSADNYQTNGHGDNFELQNRQGSTSGLSSKKSLPANGKKTKGRVKIKMEFIDNKLRRYTTFSKRKTGIMKKAYELSTLTGTQVMLLVASETGHVYTFATRKLQPMITSEAGKALIQTCLNSPDLPPGGSSDQRMSATGFEETDLSYSVPEDDKMPDSPDAGSYPSELTPPPLMHPPFTPKSSPSPLLTTTSTSSLTTGPSAMPFTTILTTAGNTKSQPTSESSSSSHNSISVVQSPSPNLSVVSGSVVLPQGAILQAAGNQGAVLYQMGQGLVYAAQANLPEGVVLNLQQETGAPQQQYITIPVSLSLSPAQQQMPPVISQSSNFGSRKERPRK